MLSLFIHAVVFSCWVTVTFILIPVIWWRSDERDTSRRAELTLLSMVIMTLYGFIAIGHGIALFAE